jgi:hypothetical protein
MNLHQQQLAFTASIRNPQQQTRVEGVAPQRLTVYRELFLNNIFETLGNAFPILSQLLPESQWRTLCEKFFAEHHCHTPYLSHVPGEFVDFVNNNDEQPLWLQELAQWERTELELFLAPDDDTSNTGEPGDDLLNGIPLLSPLLRLHAFHYPVHQLGPDNPPGEPGKQPCYLLAWRKLDHSIGFAELNPLNALLVQHLHDNRELSGHGLLQRIADEQQAHAADDIIKGGTETLYNFYRNGIVIGSRSLLTKEPQNELAV